MLHEQIETVNVQRKEMELIEKIGKKWRTLEKGLTVPCDYKRGSHESIRNISEKSPAPFPYAIEID